MSSFLSKISKVSKSDDDDGLPEDVAQHEGQDILRLMNIDPVTDIPDHVLVPDKIKKIRLRTSTPQGYLFSDVEEFHANALETIEYLLDALHQRDVDVARLASEHDRAMVDLQNRRYENEFLSTQTAQATMAGANEESLKIRARDLESEKVSLLAQLEELESQRADAAARAADLEAQLVAMRSGAVTASVTTDDAAPLNDVERQAYEELQAWADAAEAANSELVERCEALEAQVAELQTEAERLRLGMEASENYARELNDYIDDLERAYGGEDDTTASSVEVEGESEEQTHSVEPVYTSQTSEDAPASALQEELEPAFEQAVEQSHDDEYAPAVTATPDSETLSIPETAKPPAPKRPRNDETPEERMDRMMREILEDDVTSAAPELGGGVKRTVQGYEMGEVKPGQPLKSIPPGADPEDYL